MKKNENSKSTRHKVIVGLAISGVAVAALAAGSGHERRSRRGGHQGFDNWSVTELEAELDKHSWMLDRYGVSEIQVVALIEELRATEPEIERLRAEKERLGNELASLIAADVIDPAGVEALRTEILALTQQAVALGFDTMVAVSDDLTAEQRRDLVEHWRSR